MFRSLNSGNGWSSISPPTQAGDVTAFVAPYVLSHDDPAVLYAGRSRVYRSNNQGGGWSATHGGTPLSPGNPVLSLATSPTDANVAYAGTAPLAGSARIFRTRNGGATWDDVTGALPDRYPSDLTIAPNDPDRVVATFMGFGTSHVFLTDDGGDTWQDIGTGLPDIPTSAAEIDPDYPAVLYVGTDLGIYVSLDSGASWQPFNDGMPLTMINDLKVFLPGRKLRAATHGSGAWERDLFDPANCAVPGEATNLVLADGGGATTLSWDPAPGSLRYDTVASRVADDFDTDPSARCVESDDDDTTATDVALVAPGDAWYYLVVPQNLCGFGSAGQASSGSPRVVQDCPDNGIGTD
jgi:hypothetical protein